MGLRRSATACRRFSDTRPRAGHGLRNDPLKRDSLKFLGRLDRKGQIVTGATLRQKSITAQIVEGGGDDVAPVKDNQKNLQKNLKDAIETAFDAAVFPAVPLGWRRPEGGSAHRTPHDRRAARKGRWDRMRGADRPPNLPREALGARKK